VAQKIPDLSIDLAPDHPRGLKLDNPVMIASGTLGYDGYGRGLIGNYPLEELGAVVPKTVTRWPREGNPEPRWFPQSYREAWDEGDHLFLNAIGLINPGIETAVREWTPQWADWNATVLFSFAAHSVGEFGEMAALTREAVGISALELNLSCPNVENGAMFGHSPALTHDAVAAVRANSDLPVLVKLAPDVPDVTEIARAAVDGGANALTICNTLPAMRIDLETRRPVLGNITGGLSGMGLRPVSLALVYQASAVVDVPIIGVGGIFEPDHAIEYILAGASAVQVGSANLISLGAPWRILDGIREFMSENGIHSLSEIRAAAHPAPVG
jgi:dihydroorotate dehydrogenase (NAD+) catalytic subunit